MLPVDVAKQYPYRVIAVEPLGNGFINDTFLVTTDVKPFVLQKINQQVFPQPTQIMANLTALNQHVKQNNYPNISLKIPDLLETQSHSTFVCDNQDNYWRALSYIENTESLETINNLEQARQVGYALGQFHRLTQNIEVSKLYDTLPGFHIAPGYLDNYERARRRAKIPENTYCRDFISNFQYVVHDLEAAKGQGLLAERVIHGDPKLNNFLFDKTSQQIVSIIDLDTVKPGLIHYDIGDCLRSCCHNTETGEFSLDVCNAILTSYLEEMGRVFSGNDYQFLYPAIRLIPFELGIRFYTDYLEGNCYFKVTEPYENLHRANGQFLLCASVIAQEAEIKKLIKKLQAQFWS
jgi:Ser/Thr protein kinase RdoA (MazF antagonist)